MARVSAPGKLILFGEHAVVYDRFGIAAAIGLRTVAGAEADERVVVDNPPYGRLERGRKELDAMVDEINGLVGKRDFGKLRKFIQPQPLLNNCVVAAEALRLLGQDGGVRLGIDCKVPAGGLGRSSSVYAAEAGAICACFGDIDLKTVARASYLGDVVAHGGTPSGIDNSTCTYGGYVGFRKSEGAKPLRVGASLPVVIGDTGVASSTAETVTALRERRAREPAKVGGLLDAIDGVAGEALAALKKEDTERLGELMNENQRLLSELGLSHPALDALVKAGLDAGALGAKLSGKGRGGVMFALCADEDGQRKAALAIKRAGGTPIITSIGVGGVAAL